MKIIECLNSDVSHFVMPTTVLKDIESVQYNASTFVVPTTPFEIFGVSGFRLFEFCYAHNGFEGFYVCDF